MTAFYIVLTKYINEIFRFFFLKNILNWSDGRKYSRKNIDKSAKEKTAKNNSNSKKA